MPYPIDLKGKYINLSLDGGYGNMDASLQDEVLPNQTNDQSTPVLSSPSDMLSTNPAFTFTWLKYYPGYITTAPLAGTVMTGPMTGCYLCTYDRGGRKLAHVGTEANSASKNTHRVKIDCLDFVNNHQLSNSVMGEKPTSCISKGEIITAMKGAQGDFRIVGCFTALGAHAMLITGMRASRTMWKVALVKPMTLRPWDSIARTTDFYL